MGTGNKPNEGASGLRPFPMGSPGGVKKRWKDDKLQFGHVTWAIDHWDRDILGSGAGGAGVEGWKSWSH